MDASPLKLSNSEAGNPTSGQERGKETPMDDPRRTERPPIRDLRYSGRGHPDPRLGLRQRSRHRPQDLHAGPMGRGQTLLVLDRKRGIRGRPADQPSTRVPWISRSLVVALPLGLLAGTFKPAEAFLEPAMDFIRYMPAVAFVPLMMLWCGVGELSKVSIIFIGTFFQMVLMFADDVRKVPMQQIEAAQTMGGTRQEILYKAIFPSAAPSLLTTCRITLGWAWTYLVVAEIVAANSGLGYAVLKAQHFLQTDKIFAGLIVIGFLGLIQDQLLRVLHHALFPYLRRQ